MVNTFFLLFIASLSLFNGGWAQVVDVSAEIDVGIHYEHQPIKGTITVTHPEDQPVDEKSFLLGKDPLRVDFIKQVKISPTDPLVLSFYRFELSGNDKGLYVLPPVSVKVGGVLYRSVASSYSVEAEKVPSSPFPSSKRPVPATAAAAPQRSSPPSLKLEAYIEGKSDVYPGEQFKAVYRYLFKGDIDLDKEVLPLLNAEGFTKIGEKEIVDGAEGDTSIRTIAQLYEAVKPGTYTFGPSKIEGYAYAEEAAGRKSYFPDKLVSEAPAVTILVTPFPDQDKPSTFNGAIGDFTFTASLLSKPEMTVGEEFSLALTVTGKGNFKTVSFTDLCCQPGFSGFFKLDDLPPVESVKGGSKTVVVKMRPMTDRIEAIPSLVFSFFDPDAGQYKVVRSDPIPIAVHAGKLPPLPSVEGMAESPDASGPATVKDGEPPATKQPRPIEIEGILPLGSFDLQALPFGNWWVLALIPLGTAAVIYQWRLKHYLEWRNAQPHFVDSKAVFDRAFSSGRGEGPWDQEQLKAAFKQALYEAKLVESPDIDDSGLPVEGVGGQVRALLSDLDERRFSGKREVTSAEAYKLAKPLFDKIRQLPAEGNKGGSQ